MPITTCNSAETLRAEFDLVRKQVTLEETEETWDAISQGIMHLTRLCNNGGCEFPSEMVASIRSMSKPLSGALNSERTRLSGAATELLTALAIGLASSFEPLVSCFVPTLLTLCGRTNKVFTSRARTCVLAIVEHTRLPSLLPHLAGLANQKSVLPRLTAAEGMLACLNCLNPPDLEKETRARVVEDFIKLTARDASADVRKASKEVFKAYKILMPARVDSFVAPLTPVVKKYLDIQTAPSGGRVVSTNAGQKQTSRPSSRANNKVAEAPQRSTSSTLSKPLVRPATDNAIHSTRPAVHNLPSTVDVRGPRQRIVPQMQRDPPQPRNLHIVPTQPSIVAQRCAVPPSAPVRPIVQHPPPGVARTMPTRNVTSVGGPQRPPPMQLKFNASDRLKVSGNGAKRIPLPVAPVNTHASEPVAAPANPADRASNAVEQPRAKLPSRNVETAVSRKLVVGRKAAEGARSASSSTKPTNGTASTDLTAAKRPHKHSTKDGTTNTSGLATRRRPVGNGEKGTRPQVKAERKETSPALVPLPPSPSIPPTEIPLPPSPECTPHRIDPGAQPAMEVQPTSNDPVSNGLTEQVSGSTESCQERDDTDSPNTPITSLLSSIQRGFLFTPTSPLSPPQNYVLPSGNLLEKTQNTIVVSEFTKSSLPVGAPFCIPPEEHSAVDGIDRYALRDLN